MAEYVQATDFSAKDALATGNPSKIIYGADVDVELGAISVAVASKIDDPSGTLTTLETTDKILVQDVSDADNTKTITRLAFADQLMGLQTKQATTSGVAIDFTGIPSGAKRITVMLVGVDTSGSDDLLVQLGDSGGFETSGYLSNSAALTDSGTIGLTAYTSGFGIRGGAAAQVFHGALTLILEDASDFTFVSTHNIIRSDAARVIVGAGRKATSAELTQVRITTTGGSDTFTAGEINLIVEM